MPYNVAKYATPLASMTWKTKADKNSRNGKGVDLPAIICDRNKNANDANFSKNEFKNYIRRVQNGQVLTPFTAKLRCRLCAADPSPELQCQNCLVTKSKDDFSLSQRTRPEVAWCKACVNWQEMNEPGTEMLPGPSMGLAPNNNIDDLDEDYADCQFLNAGQADLDDERLAWGTINTDNTTASNPNVVPATTSATISASILSNEVQVGHRVLPDRDVHSDCDSDDGSGSSASNPYESPALANAFWQLDPFQNRGANGSKAKGTRDGDDDFRRVAPKKKNPAKTAVTYTAYGPTGQAYTMTRAGSPSSATSGAAGTTSGSQAYSQPFMKTGNVRPPRVNTKDVNTRDWAKVPSGKTAARPDMLKSFGRAKDQQSLLETAKGFNDYIPDPSDYAPSNAGVELYDGDDSFDEA